jgi:signal transduction histidine kinase
MFKPVMPGEFGGAGIGLLVVHQAITAQGGAVGFESEPGKGSCFWFTLPRAA